LAGSAGQPIDAIGAHWRASRASERGVDLGDIVALWLIEISVRTSAAP